MSTPPILSVRDLRVSFTGQKGQRIVAVDGVSFDLMPGEILGIVGESGSGKSVTGQAIMRLLPKNATVEHGQTLLYPGTQNEIDTSTLPPASRQATSLRGKAVSVVFQEPMAALSPVHTIGSQIIEAIRIHRKVSQRKARKIAIDLLTQVRINEPERRIDQYSFELSGGMRQRAMIAIALAGDPDILIADEPTTALDVTTQAHILQLLKEIQSERHMAVIFVSHDLGVIAQLADRVVSMYQGKVMETGTVKQVFEAPTNSYTQTLLAAVKGLDTPVRVHTENAVEHANDPILRVRNLHTEFTIPTGFMQKPKMFKAVNGVSLDIARGETLALVGESGSGKTTFGRSILRAINPTKGEITFHPSNGDTFDVTQASRAEMLPYRRWMQMIFQDPFASLSPRMTVRNIIAEPYRAMIGEDGLEEALKEITERCRINPEWLSRYPHAFSGGQRQRIGIARALITRPELVVCDEAVSALDVTIQADVLELLMDLQQDLGLTYLFITHDMSVVRHISDRVAVLLKGELVEIGSADAVLNAPQNDYTKRLLAAVPHADPEQRMFDKGRLAIG
nr:ABC transporter ATP-binding protein [Shimia sp. R10_1]